MEVHLLKVILQNLNILDIYLICMRMDKTVLCCVLIMSAMFIASFVVCTTL